MQKKSIRSARIVRDTQIYQARNVSRDYGRKVLKALAAKGEITPDQTGTGRNYLTFADAEKLADAL